MISLSSETRVTLDGLLVRPPWSLKENGELNRSYQPGSLEPSQIAKYLEPYSQLQARIENSTRAQLGLARLMILLLGTLTRTACSGHAA